MTIFRELNHWEEERPTRIGPFAISQKSRRVQASFHKAISAFYGTLFVPVIDGTFITQRPTLALREDIQIRGLACLSGHDQHERREPLCEPDGCVHGCLHIRWSIVSQVGLKVKKRSTEAILWFEDYSQLGESRHGGSDSHMPNFLHVTKTHFMSMASTRSRVNSAASTNSRSSVVPPAMHGMDISYYFPSTSPITSPITFQNPRFSAAFSQSFLSFVFSLNPHNKINPREDITPPWPMYPIANMGMVFNKTAVGNGNDVHPVQVDDGLLQRCSFRESLGALTGQ